MRSYLGLLVALSAASLGNAAKSLSHPFYSTSLMKTTAFPAEITTTFSGGVSMPTINPAVATMIFFSKADCKNKPRATATYSNLEGAGWWNFTMNTAGAVQARVLPTALPNKADAIKTPGSLCLISKDSALIGVDQEDHQLIADSLPFADPDAQDTIFVQDNLDAISQSDVFPVRHLEGIKYLLYESTNTNQPQCQMGTCFNDEHGFLVAGRLFYVHSETDFDV